MVYIPVNIEEAIKKECGRRRYSKRTFQAYLFCVNRFLKFTNKELGKISKKDVREFLENLDARGRSGNTLNTYHMAIRFLFEEVLDKRIWLNLRYSKIPERLPAVLTKEEVKKLLASIKNHKHRIMVSLMYSSGLRVSELTDLEVGDLNLKEKHGFVRGGKGNKDRLFIIADKLERVLIQLFAGRNKNEYLFANKGKKYSVSSLQKIVKNAAKHAGLNWKEIHCHTLRHSFATHLIEAGYSVSEVQALLGHKSPETTFIYLHTSAPTMLKIKSPLDSL